MCSRLPIRHSWTFCHRRAPPTLAGAGRITRHLGGHWGITQAQAENWTPPALILRPLPPEVKHQLLCTQQLGRFPASVTGGLWALSALSTGKTPDP